MLGLGVAEIICVFLLILALFGPKELPHLARLILRVINEMKSLFYRLEAGWKNEKSLLPDPPPPANPLQERGKKRENLSPEV